MRCALALVLLASAGCVTSAGRQAAADVAAETRAAAEQGCPPNDPGMTAAAREAEGVRRQVGGPAPARRSPEAMNATAARMEADIAFWAQAGAWFKGVLPNIPYVGGALAAALGLWQAVRKSKLAARAEEVAGVLGRAASSGKPLAEALAGEASNLVKINLDDVRRAVSDAVKGEI